MLEEFITSNRDDIVAGIQSRVSTNPYSKPSKMELANGVPVFLDQLCDALRLAKLTEAIDHEQLGKSAGRHGHDLLKIGLTIAQVVHVYGEVCQTVTEMAIELKAPISGEEFRTLNLCLDDAMAEAVTEYSFQRERTIVEEGKEQLGILAHELRNLLNTAVLSFELIKSGRVAPGGSTALLHSRTLKGLQDLIDRSLADVRIDAGIKYLESIIVADFIEEIEISAVIQAQASKLRFEVTSVKRDVLIEGDRQILAGAVSNLLQNAFKFSRPKGRVALTARSTDDRVYFEVEDECGGLPPGKTNQLFQPFHQQGPDRSGLGLGLTICAKAAKANGGEIYVRDLPGKGCIFALDLPRKKVRAGF